ncbi:hypothetical protein TNCV_2862431 [Trichonephila clavipes]|nr:hypothetical protein TNCV_2862431 [Trichonephila clavipes]
MEAATLDAASQTEASSMVINDESGRTNGETALFQMNLSSVYSIKMIAPVFGGIVVKAHWQRAFRHRHTGPSPGVMLLDAHLDHLLFPLMVL